MTEKTSLRGRVVSGLLWQTMGSGSERVLRLLVNILGARLLAPDTFGLTWMVMTASATIDAVTFLATDEAMICNDHGHELEYQNTVFWIASMRGLILGTVLLAAAPLLAFFFGQIHSVALFAVISLQPVIAGFSSPRAQILIKEMKFKAWAAYRLIAQVVGVGTTIALAIFLRNAWSLVLGLLITQLMQTVGSYVVAPFRPHFHRDLQYRKEVLSFCGKAAGTPILLAAIFQAPALILGKFFGPAVLGVFFINQRLAMLPSEFSLQIVMTVVMPLYGKLKHDPIRLERAWMSALRGVALVSLPMTTVLVLLGSSLPRWIYGVRYADTTHVFAILSLGGAFLGMAAVAGPLFWAVGLPSYDRLAQLVRAVAIYSMGAWMALSLRETGFALATTLSLALTLIYSIYLVRHILKAQWWMFALQILPGLGLSALVAVVFLTIQRTAPVAWRGLVLAQLMAAGILILLSAAWTLLRVRAWGARQVAG